MAAKSHCMREVPFSWVPVFMLVLMVLPRLAAAQQRMGPPEVSSAIYYGVSQPLRDIPPKLDFERHERPLLRIHPVRPFTAVSDPVAQTTVTTNVATSSGLNFLGIGKGFSSFTVNAAPPDTNGAVGVTQYVQWVNTSYAVFDKSTGATLYGPTAGNTLWSGFSGPCAQTNDGDVIAQYDKAADRWVMAQLSYSQAPPYYLCVAVSTTGDATGTYQMYSFAYNNLNDYPKLGIWPDGYYASYNMFQGNTFVGAQVCAFDRSSMLIGAPATQQCLQLNNSYGGLLPSDLDGATAPPAGSPNYFVAFDSNLASLDLWRFHVNWTTPANTTLTGPINLSVPTFSEACGGGTCIPQSGTQQKLDSLGDRLMYRLAYRNLGTSESLVVNHSVTSGSSVGIRWYELRDPGGTPQIYQASTFAPDANYRWMGSIAMDQSGNMALGYSVSSSSMYPSIRYTGRSVTDALNTMQSETQIVAGTASQSYTFGGLSRWGDYSSISIDPVDDCTFWYTTEYLVTNNSFTFNWSTRIASFKFPTCGGGTVAAPATPTGLAATAGDAQVALSWNASSGATSYDVYRSTTSGGEVRYISGLTTTTYTDTGVTNGNTYYYKVSALTSGLESALSSEVSATPQAPVSGDFSLSANPTSISISVGSSGSSVVSVTSSGGYSGTVTFSVSGLPKFASGSFNPTSIVTSGSTTMTIKTNRRVSRGSYPLTVTGSDGTRSHTTTVTLNIT